MVANSVKRSDYDDLIVSFTGPRCNYSSAVGVLAPAAGPAFPSGRVVLRVLPAARQAFRALAAVMLAYGYAFEETAGGTLNCRYIGGTRSTSFHAHGIAGDWNPSRNRYRVYAGTIQWGRQTDMPMAMVRAIESIRTVSGHPVWEWGGRWTNVKDPMHYELDLRRSHLETGINLATLPAGSWSKYLAFEGGAAAPNPPTEGDTLLPITKDSPREDVRMLQHRLNAQHWRGDTDDGIDPLEEDGIYGPKTAAFVSRKTGSLTGNADWAAGNGVGQRQWDFICLAFYRKELGVSSGGTIDSTARSQAAAARTIAEKAAAGADRANSTLDKIRSE